VITRRRILLTLAALAFAWLATGLYVVESDQLGMVRRFGRLAAEPSPPGLHVDLPWPLARVDRIRPDETRQVQVGFVAEGERVRVILSEERESEFFTGDQNLIHVQATAQYRLADPAAYLFGQESPEKLLKLAMEASLAEAVASVGVDSLLTAGRGEVQRRVLERSQQLADRYALGATLLAVDFSSVRPPVLVQREFEDAVTAKNDKARYVHDARSQRLETLAQAAGQQRRLLDDAAAYRDRAIKKATGDAAWFQAIVGELEKTTDPEARRRARSLAMVRLWYESLSRVLPKLKEKLFVDPGEKVDVVIPGDR
jgi:membrane protease subunit HflK